MGDAMFPVMRPKKQMKSPFVVTVSVAAMAAGLMACGGKVNGASSGGPDGPDNQGSSGSSGSSSGYSVNPPIPPTEPTQTTNPPAPPQECPVDEPTEGANCGASFGGACSYDDRCVGRPIGQSAYKSYNCWSGTWHRLSHYNASCPVNQPNPGDSCASCAGDYPAECKYGADTGCPPAVAVCEPKTNTWVVAVSSCNPPPPPQDAGAGGM